MQNSYLRLEDDPARASGIPCSTGSRTRPRIINGRTALEVTTRRAQFPHPPLTLIPSYPDLPMEKVYPARAEDRHPGGLLREVGAGRVVYFPWDIDRTFWEVLAVDHGMLLRNAVAVGDERGAAGHGRRAPACST